MSSTEDGQPPAASSIIQLANVSAQYGNSVFAEADASFASATPSTTIFTDNGAAQSTSTSTSTSTGAVASSSGQSLEPMLPSQVTSGLTPPDKRRKKNCTAPKQHQLPMFLTSK